MARIGLEAQIAAVLLAGGLGSRIRTLFPGIPKPMIPVAGVPVSEWILRLWAHQGIRYFIFSTGYLGNTIEEYFRSRQEFAGLQIECVREPVPLGTGGALAFVAEKIPQCDVLLVANGDSLCLIDIVSCFAEFTARNADVLMGTCFREDTSQFGSVEIDNKSRILSFREKVAGPGFVNAGVYIIRTALLSQATAAHSPISLERDLFPRFLNEGAVFISHPLNGPFLDIGTPAGYTAAEEFIHAHSDFETVRNLRWD
jgi:NDP-sugar pyrophosphorylase family protein